MFCEFGCGNGALYQVQRSDGELRNCCGSCRDEVTSRWPSEYKDVTKVFGKTEREAATKKELDAILKQRKQHGTTFTEGI